MSRRQTPQEFLENRKVKRGKRRINAFWMFVFAAIVISGVTYVGFKIVPPYQAAILYDIIGNGPTIEENSIAQDNAVPKTSLPPSDIQ